MNTKTHAPEPDKAQTRPQSPAKTLLRTPTLSPPSQDSGLSAAGGREKGPAPAQVQGHTLARLPVQAPAAPLIQTKLLVNRVGDEFEQEADRAAEQVMATARPRPGLVRMGVAGGAAAGVQRQPASTPALSPLPRRRRKKQEEGCCPDEAVQAEALPGQSPTAGNSLEGRLKSLQGGGQPLPPTARAFFESRFGYNFSGVRVHTGPAAAETAQSAQARAFTRGHDLVFGAGQWSPESSAGQRLLAHELAHVIQQNGGSPGDPPTIQRQALEEAEASPPAPAEVPAAQAVLIVEDDATDVQPNQMRKTEFLTQLRQQVCLAADEVLAVVGRSSQGCPYLEYWFDYYSRKDSAQVERTARRYEPALASATSAADFIPMLVQRVRAGLVRWVMTGEVSGVPAGVPLDLPGSAPGSAEREAQSSGAEEPSTGAAQETTGESEMVLRKARLPGTPYPDGGVSRNPSVLLERLGSGQPLEGGVQARMENAFGASFSHVRMHTGPDAALLSDQLHSRAFAVGSHIAFAGGEYQPGTLIGDALLAHELAHVIQQGGSVPFPALSRDVSQSDPGSTSLEAAGALEADADTAALGAVVALWTGARGALKKLARNAKPALKSGLRLQSCDGSSSSTTSTAAPSASRAPTPPPPPPPPATTPSDFQVLGLEAAAWDIGHIYFDRSSASIDARELPKVPKIIKTYGKTNNLTLIGFRSEDEPASLADDRNNAVDTELGTARTTAPAHPAHTGTRAKVNSAASSIGEINYRQVRSVEIKPTPKGSAAATSSRPSTCTTAVVTCPPSPNHFTRAKTRAETMLTKAITELNKATLDPAVATLVDTLFGGGTGTAPAGTAAFIAGKLTDLKTHVGNMPAQHVCHNLCDSDCNNSEAYNIGTGASAMMTLCPTFFSNTDTNNAVTLIHEGSHGTTGLATKDRSYGHERGILILSTSDAKINADSYALLVRLINYPGSASIGYSGDVRVGMNPTTEEPVAKRALAFLEKWLVFAYQTTASVYSTANEAQRTSTWPSSAPGPFGRSMMSKLSADFPLTDPGASAPFTLPTSDDVFKLAAIYDRFYTMREVMHSSPVTMEKIASGSDQWDPGPGAKVKLTDAFFLLPDDLSRVKRLLELLLIATPNISPAARPMYISAANDIRKVKGAGP